MSNITLGTLYELNKDIILQQGKLGKKKINEIKPQLEDWFNWRIDGYAMLLCRERYDFTVFHLYELENDNPCAVAASELIDVLKNRGDILSIEQEEGAKWEIWLNIDGEAYAYYLFGCEDWVIEC